MKSPVLPGILHEETLPNVRSNHMKQPNPESHLSDTLCIPAYAKITRA
jgi:hypothetical protein